jgi:Domain of unknown function (DUF4352)
MKSPPFFKRLAFALGAPSLVAACTTSQNLGSRPTADACALAAACCATLSTAASSVCEGQVSTAQAQSDAQTACGVLLQGYQGDGLCSSVSNDDNDGGARVVPSSDGSAPSGDGSPVSSSSIQGVTLTVESSQQITSFGSYSISSESAGQVWVAVVLALDNGSTSALPLAFALFTADTTSGIQYTGNTETGVYPGGCDPTTSLSSGHSTTCSLLFQTPSTAVTSSLAYQLPNGASVSVPLVTVTCTVCAGACTDLTTDPKNCGTCGNAIDQAGTCENGKLVCPNGEAACGATCTDTQTDSSNCGSCGKACGIPGLLPGNCLGGECTACMPGASGCATTTSTESCDSNGQWGTPVQCTGNEVCDSEQSYTACVPPPQGQ